MEDCKTSHSTLAQKSMEAVQFSNQPTCMALCVYPYWG